MEIIGLQGQAPGPVVAAVAHEGRTARLRLRVERHPMGGWHVRQSCGAWGPRCHSMAASVLLEASAVFAADVPRDGGVLALAA